MSTLLRSRAQIDQEVRTAQFLIERLCPVLFPEGDSDIEKLLPTSVWVLLGVNRKQDPSASCDGQKYAVVKKDAIAIRKQVGLETHAHKHVCEHMGRIIE